LNPSASRPESLDQLGQHGEGRVVAEIRRADDGRADAVAGELPEAGVVVVDRARVDLRGEAIWAAAGRPEAFDPRPQVCRILPDQCRQCGIETVAMESTGVYWIPLFQILEERGFAVYLVNARHVKNVPGRRTDVSDCQWLQFLHSVGLLKASYRSAQEVCAVRSLLRHRESLVGPVRGRSSFAAGTARRSGERPS
jgi:hypothetical protein